MKVPRLRQKIFFWGALANGAMAAGSIIGIKQGSDSQEEQEEANRQAAKASQQAAEEQRRHNLAMEEAARNNPGAIQTSYSALSNATGFAKDLWKTQKNNIVSAAGAGLGLAATGYLGNRLLTSIKDNDSGDNSDTKRFLAKTAVGVGTIGGSIMAAKTGMLGKAAQSFMTTGKGGSFLRGMNPIVRDEVTHKISLGKTLGKNAVNAAFIAMPTGMYMLSKKSKKDMIDNTHPEDQQKEYSILSGVTGRLSNWYGRLKTNPGEALSSAASHVGSTFGFYGQGGTKNVQEQVSELAKSGQASGNSWTKKTADWLARHKNTANLIYGAGALGVGTGIFKATESAVDIPMKKIDKHTYESTEEDDQI